MPAEPMNTAAPKTLWSPAAPPDARALAYTIGDDPHWDTRLLRFDVLGSLGHIVGLRRAGLLSPGDHARLHNHLVAALAAIERGELQLAPEQEDVHTAVELWLSSRDLELGQRLHTGRSRNDQVACDLRLFMKDALLGLLDLGTRLATVLCEFAALHERVLWPGFTHQRRAMPSSLGLWAAAFAEGLVDTLEAGPALLAQIGRSLLFFCTQLGHELSRLASDVCLYSAEEFGFLILPSELATGSSLMPHKRNPDVFELTRARAAALEGDLVQLRFVAGKLTSGYHRCFEGCSAPSRCSTS